MAAPTISPAAKAIIEIERLGFTWREDAAYDLERLDVKRRVQVRESKNYAPREQVERYAIQMGESVFPPVIVTKDDWIVDGNTRVGASLVRKQKFFPAIVLDVSYDTEKAKRPLLDALAATLNSQNGEPLTARERRTVAAKFIELAWKPDQIARAIGVKPATLTQVKQELDALRMMNDVGMSNGHLSAAALRSLGKKPAIHLNKKPYRDLAELAESAALNSSEITDIAKTAKDTGSDDDAVEVIAKAKTEFAERIRERTLTGAVKPPLARQLRQHLGFVTRFDSGVTEIIETNPAVAAQHIQALEKAVDVLTRALAEQKARISA